MSEDRFLNLVKQNNGFEYVIAYRDFEDHCIGGKGNVFWYTVLRDGKVYESFIGSLEGETWKDVRVKGSGKRRKEIEKPSGSTIRRISEKAFVWQDEDWVKNRKPRVIEDSHPHYHYVYGFGDKALDVSVQYGISIGLSDLSDVPAGFHLRYLYVGDDVKAPD